MLESGWDTGEPRFEADEMVPLMASYPWSGHRRFAYDLVRFVQPRRLVELGAHIGTSFFAFCQAVKDARLATQCVAVDSWEGDEQAGFYGQEIYEQFRQIIAKFYAGLDILQLKMFFRDALREVPDDSVNLLHIDGLHTYEAVAEDFHSWLGKLTADGVVLFHDVAESTGYGSARFWGEIKQRFPSLEFAHSWGLGILFPKGDGVYRALLQQNIHDKMRYYQYRSEHELSRLQLRDADQQVRERDALIRQQDELVKQRDESIASLEAFVRSRDEDIRRQDEVLRDHDACIASQTRLIDERDACIASQTRLIDERDAYIRSLEKQVGELREALQAARTRLERLERELQRPLVCLRALFESLRTSLRLKR